MNNCADLKKRYFFMLIMLLSVIPSLAQNERLYLFRSDYGFNEFKVSDLKEIRYESDLNGAFTDIVVSTILGDEKKVAMTAIDSVVVRQSDIPDLYVDLIDYPDIDDLFKNNGFTKRTIYAAKLRIDGNGMYEDVPKQEVEFRGRGNSTWYYPKTPYRFKMKKKASVCGMKKAKSFALIANYIDNTLMRNTVALNVALELGLPYSNHSIPCNVYLNGKYRGSYMMTEKIGIGGGSVDIDENTGMLFELDLYMDEDYKYDQYFLGNKRLPVTVKDPDLAELYPDAVEREAYFQQWKSDFGEMVNAVTTSGEHSISDYIDLEQAAKYVLVNSVALNRELLHPKSVYLYKEGLGRDYTYKFGPAWDFDWGFGYDDVLPDIPLFSGDTSPNYSGGTFFKLLASNEEFMNVYRKEWATFYESVYPKILTLIDSYSKDIEPSAKLDGLKWGASTNTFDAAKNVKALKDYFIKRVEYCNEHENYGLFD